ncbi:hypothetical protein [Acinetobacter rathckeae]|uniref:hypothetical protein n=1 Tax=Acinetobacter rathckeae TaxID=2605272 RepID=UPI0018A2915B|nr:hypothetical protein [Acinetobacter rathckeae]MBF7688743.1 hypothetical protein [Acinetobacter rathckeae]MBF7696136.1 hypothetical protein [Acinetobacter rathckeae]
MKAIAKHSVQFMLGIAVLVGTTQLWAHEGHTAGESDCATPCKVKTKQSAPHHHMSDKEHMDHTKMNMSEANTQK